MEAGYMLLNTYLLKEKEKKKKNLFPLSVELSSGKQTSLGVNGYHIILIFKLLIG